MKLSELKVSKLNVRDQNHDEEEFKYLIDSIKDKGLLCKLILRKDKDIEIVAGSRRFRALKEIRGDDGELADSEYILMEDLSDIDALCISIYENQGRKPLSPFELNKTILDLNRLGKKEKEIAKILGITPFRIKRLETLSADSNKMSEDIKNELHKVESPFSDAHWNRLRDIDDKDTVKDVYDQIMQKELPPKEIPSIIKAIEKAKNAAEPSKQDQKTSYTADQDENKEPTSIDSPIVYEHKGEIMLVEKKDSAPQLYIRLKSGDEEIPIKHYLEFLRNSEKFQCFVNFKLTVKPKE